MLDIFKLYVIILVIINYMTYVDIPNQNSIYKKQKVSFVDIGTRPNIVGKKNDPKRLLK